MATVTPAQIDAATTALDLQKMQTKLQAEAIDNAKAASDAMRALVERQAKAGEEMVAEFKRQASIADAGGTRRELVQMLFRELVAGYMKPGTATVLETQATDAKNDGQYLGLAMDEALKVYDAQIAKVGVA